MSEALYQPFPMLGRARAHIWRHQPQTRRPRHFHLEPELNLVAAGTGSFGIGEAVVPVVAGDLLCFLPGQDHVLLEASPDFDLFVVGLTPALSERVLDVDVRAGSLPCGPARLLLPPDVLERFRGLCTAPLADREADVVERHVGDFWREAHGHRLAAAQMHPLTRRALVSLVERPDRARADLALLARGDPTEVSRHFHGDVGLTLTAYRTRLRLLCFIQAADGGGGNLLAAALAAGFGSYSQCHRAFRRVLGCSPRAFFGTDARRSMADTFVRV